MHMPSRWIVRHTQAGMGWQGALRTCELVFLVLLSLHGGLHLVLTLGSSLGQIVPHLLYLITRHISNLSTLAAQPTMHPSIHELSGWLCKLQCLGLSV